MPEHDIDVLIKISGDLIQNKGAGDFILSKANHKDNPNVTVICGGRTQINKHLEVHHIEPTFEDGIRIHETDESAWLARSVLWHNRANLYNMLQHPDNVEILVPCQVIRDHICHFDADEYFRILHHNFDEAYCLTKTGRTKHFPSAVKVVHFA